ncbi:MAG: hypothetical protein DMG61_18460 [Acidobacteria bacterium]|nr:MAG: hypothetical protein DMG61_18460 [Acidobacteriota bacterium]
MLGLPRSCPEVCSARALVSRSNAIFPVIAVCKATAWPAHNRRVNPAERLNQSRSDPVRVRNLRIFADPDAVVNDSTEMLGEVPINVRRDCANRLV